jgi:hypothetical protein
MGTLALRSSLKPPHPRIALDLHWWIVENVARGDPDHGTIASTGVAPKLDANTARQTIRD